jgi:hypothetical protein
MTEYRPIHDRSDLQPCRWQQSELGQYRQYAQMIPLFGREDNQKEARIQQIQQQTRQNYCKPRREVEREIRERQERLKAVENKPNPTSAKATQPQRIRRRTAEKTPPAWS